MMTLAAKEFLARIRSGAYTFDENTREGWLGFRAELERVHGTTDWPEWVREQAWNFAVADFEEEFISEDKLPLHAAILYGRVVQYTRALVDRTPKGSLP